MRRLSEDGFAEAVARYRDESLFFPLIGAVLSRAQDGDVYCDDSRKPTQFYVQHSSGFAQIFGSPNPGFETELARRLLIERAGDVAKVRLYAPVVPTAIAALDTTPFRSQRQRFRLDLASRRGRRLGGVAGVAIRPAGRQDIDELEAAFGIVTRFWRSPEDFLTHARAVVVLDGGTIASVCCAAAVAGDRAEVDVATLASHRGRAYGSMVVSAFVERCLEAGIEPLWDCFTNNTPSMRTAVVNGFVPASAPYLFLTIPRRSA